MTRPMPANHYEELELLRKKSTRLNVSVVFLEARVVEMAARLDRVEAVIQDCLHTGSNESIEWITTIRSIINEQ